MEERVERTLETLFNDDPAAAKTRMVPLFKSLVLKRILPWKLITGICERVVSQPRSKPVSDRILELLGANYEISPNDRARIPVSGPLVVVANHPFGAIEGLILSSVLQQSRGDVKIMANFLLGALGIEELNESLLLVDPLERKASASQNIKPLRDAIQWVRGGRALGIFPAGEVSHMHFRHIGITDRPWKSSVARIIRKTEATVLPVFFEGRNSFLFCGLGLLHPLIRTVMLPRENLKRRKHTVRVSIGKPIPFKRLQDMSDAEMTDYTRMRTYNLRYRHTGNRLLKLPMFPGVKTTETCAGESVGPTRSIREEIRNLGPEQLLISTKDFGVFCATADQIPNTMRDIGRLREIAFRKVGEGTGKEIDLDRFDAYYRHIVLWNRQREEVAGAYRLGLTDEILNTRGPKGLYTSTLFDYDRQLFSKVLPALEVGRSFVRPEYQKTYQPLLLLWSGIGRFVAREPQYRFLFGSVSISNSYLGISRTLIIRCLKKEYACTDLAGFVRAKHPAADWSLWEKKLGARYSMLRNIDEVSEMVSDIEKDSKGVPILLKHYTKLGGQFLGFGVDPKFGNAVDALVLVDLTRTDPRVLGRYMGQSGLESFLRFHLIDPGLHYQCA